MTSLQGSITDSSAHLSGGGEVGALMRAIHWADTALGPLGDWPQSLRTIVGTCLHSRFPILIWWGPELVMLYNDAYAPLIGAKHPHALGARGKDVFPEIWDIIGPMLEGVLTRGEATWSEDQLLLLERRGFAEECYFTFSYSPIDDGHGGVGGVFTAVTETTARVVGERRLAMLRTLAERTASCRTVPDAIRCTMSSIEENPAGAPFALLYLFDARRESARLEATVRVGASDPSTPAVIALDPQATTDPWALSRVAAASEPLIVDVPESLRSPVPVPLTPHPVRQAAVLPVRRAGQDHASGALIIGLSPILPVDDTYFGYLRLVAGHLVTAISNAEAYEAQRQRAEELSALDRAKTAFFSNVSHEFRTPLTLLLAPVEEALADPALTVDRREQLESAHRNALRLLKLVNTLLDFTRIESGRVAASYEALDLGAFTAELASTFRSACERAGLELRVDLPDTPVIAYVDRGMWEKIVLNLVSNAFKHTFTGGITVRARAEEGEAVLEVRDTGIGIPSDQLSRVFERFHRVPNARSRSFEGTGIGLSLVQELVRLHGGRIDVDSDGESGSAFTVRVPLGTDHLPQDRIVHSHDEPAESGGAVAYVQEALRWIPESSETPQSATGATTTRLLFADDNADMREYVSRVLRAEGWHVDTFANGAAALSALRERPYDLLLSDVMMPGVDGHELVRALRADAATRSMPVILLSARAGEDARVEALATGTDDYLEKPFSARELVARVHAQLGLAAAHARAAAEAERAREIAEDASRAKSAFLAAMSHELRTPLNAIAGYADLLDLEIYGPLTLDQRTTIARLKKSGDHLLRLINDVLDFAKIEAGRIEFALADVLLADVIGSVSPMIEPQIAAKQLAYEVHVAPDLIVRADAERLQQILLNLLSNAVKFTQPGGAISVSAVVAEDAADRIYLRVHDSGVGIPLELQDRVFEPFVQGDRRASGSIQGTGLGLSISRDLARGMGGDLRVRSVAGQGSTFTLTLRRA